MLSLMRGMVKTITIDEVKTIQAVIALTVNGDEVVLEKDGEPIVKVTPIAKASKKARVAGLGKGYWMSDDFGAELSDEFWGFDKEI